MELLGFTPASRGNIVIKDTPLGKGGEGSVYEVISHSISSLPPASTLVVKIYHNPEDGNREKKVVAMVTSPPHTNAVAWAQAVVRDKKGKFMGYVMTKLPRDTYRSWAELSHVSDRRSSSPDFSVQYALMASRNLAVAIDAVHKAGHCIGDVNESNALISNDAHIMLVDTDSAQIKSSQGEIFRCLVGKPDYTAPELSHGSLREHLRTPQTDVFAYGVMLFQMLTGGAHPTNAVFHGAGDSPNMVEKIREGIYPGLVETGKEFSPVPRVPVGALPQTVKNICAKSFSVNAEQRPSMTSVIKALDSLISRLKQCTKVKNHWFDSREKGCPWCAFAKKSGTDPWNPVPIENAPKSSPVVSQQTLKPLQFGKGSKQAGGIKRAPIAQTNQVQPQSATPPQVTSPRQVQPPTSSPSPKAQSTPVSPAKKRPEAPFYPPEKIKGKLAVTNVFGAKVQRPPLVQLMEAENSRLLFQSLLYEMPSLIQPLWVKHRPFPKISALLLGLLLLPIIACSWFYVVPWVFKQLPWQGGWFEMASVYATLISVGTTSLVGGVFWFSSLMKYLQWKKKFSMYTPMSTWKAVWYFVGVDIFWGLGFIVVVLLVIVYTILGKVLDTLTQSSPKR